MKNLNKALLIAGVLAVVSGCSSIAENQTKNYVSENGSEIQISQAAPAEHLNCELLAKEKCEWAILDNLSDDEECPATICPAIQEEVIGTSRQDVLDARGAEENGVASKGTLRRPKP